MDIAIEYPYATSLITDKLTFYRIKIAKSIPFSCKYFQLKRVLNMMNKILINDEVSYIIG